MYLKRENSSAKASAVRSHHRFPTVCYFVRILNVLTLFPISSCLKDDDVMVSLKGRKQLDEIPLRNRVATEAQATCEILCEDYKGGVVVDDETIKEKVNDYIADETEATINCWNTEKVTNTDNLFFSKPDFNDDLSCWDMSSVTRMNRMFYRSTNFNSDISSWDVSSVKNMGGSFSFAANFNRDLSSWDVATVEDMQHMFAFTSKFNGDVSDWDVSNVSTMEGMFHKAKVFNNDVTSWDVSSVKTMRFMFESAIVFNNDISKWDVSSVTTMMHMFHTATSFGIKLCSWLSYNNVHYYDMFTFSKCSQSYCMECNPSTNYINLPTKFYADQTCNDIQTSGFCNGSCTYKQVNKNIKKGCDIGSEEDCKCECPGIVFNRIVKPVCKSQSKKFKKKSKRICDSSQAIAFKEITKKDCKELCLNTLDCSSYQFGKERCMLLEGGFKSIKRVKKGTFEGYKCYTSKGNSSYKEKSNTICDPAKMIDFIPRETENNCETLCNKSSKCKAFQWKKNSDNCFLFKNDKTVEKGETFDDFDCFVSG